MQTLGVATPEQPSDGIFKRLFWPEIQNQYDVDLVGQQGFWVCFLVALLSFVSLLLQGHPVLSILVLAVYLLGGVGVRERSFAAAVLVFACYLLDKLASLEWGLSGGYSGFPFAGLVGLMLLLANVRGTVLSKRWQARPDEICGELPERSVDSWSDKVANRLPGQVWPAGRYVFFPLAGLLLALTVFSMAVIPSEVQRQTTLNHEDPPAVYNVDAR